MRGASRPPAALSWFTRPGTTLRCPAAIAATPASATSAASPTTMSGALSKASVSAASANPVRVRPGLSVVRETPVPDSSPCTASEKDCTNALLAA